MAEAFLIPRFPTVVAVGGEAAYPQLHSSPGRPQGTRDHVICHFESDGAGKRKESLVIPSYSFAHQCLLPSSLWSTLGNFVVVSGRSSVVFCQDTDKWKDIFCLIFVVQMMYKII